jgi:beta-lactamase regulating signal transducer with metallopeptidase domain
MNLTQTLGWTLIHFLWEGTIVAILLASALVLLRRSWPRTRYAASCAAMVLMLAFAAGTFIEFQFSGRAPREAAGSFTPVFIDSAVRNAANATNASIPVVARGIVIADYLPLLVWAWFGGVIALGFRAFGGWMVASQFARRHTRPAEQYWQERFAALLKRLRISRAVKLAVTSTARVPAVVGWLKPVVLMPATVFTGLTVEQIEALIAHELAHVRRHDYVINLLQTAAETLLFYHPAVWWVGRCIRNERENCCDDLAVELCGNPATYVRALTDLEQLRGKTPAFAMAADGGSLLSRVERLLDLKSHVRSAPSGLLAAMGIAVLCISVIGVKASSFSRQSQSSPAPAREAAAAAPEVESPIELPPLAPEPPASLVIAEALQAPEAPPAPAAPPVPPVPPAQASQNSGDWLDEIEAAGLRDLKVEQLIALKIHGVDGKFIQDMRSLYPDITVNQILQMKIYGVTPAYVRDAKSRFKDLSVNQIIQLKIYNILK